MIGSKLDSYLYHFERINFFYGNVFVDRLKLKPAEGIGLFIQIVDDGDSVGCFFPHCCAIALYIHLFLFLSLFRSVLGKTIALALIKV